MRITVATVSLTRTIVLPAVLAGSLLALAACGNAGDSPAALESASADGGATDAVVDAAPDAGASGAVVVGHGTDAPLDSAALAERRDPERLLRYYVSAVRQGNWDAAARAWSLDAEMTPAKLKDEFGGANPRLAVGKGDTDGAAGSLYYEAPIVIDFGGGRPSKRGTIVLRRVNDVPGASETQLNWRIERTSTLTQ